MKIHRNRSSELTEEEEEAVDYLPSEQPESNASDNGLVISLTEKSMQKQSQMKNNGGKHIVPQFIVPTSNICERRYSRPGFALTDYRKAILPSNFESQIFIHVNRHLWNHADASAIVD